MKSTIILITTVAISYVSALPLGSLFGGDLTGGLLGEASGTSLGLPGLTDGDLLDVLGDLVDPSTLNLFKRELSGLFGGSLTNLLGGASGASPGLPGLTDGGLIEPLLDSTLDGTGLDVLGGNGDINSYVGDLLDPNTLDLGLLKREPNGLPPIGSLTNLDLDNTDHLDIVDILLHGDALARLGYPHGFVKRLLSDALVKRGISILSTPSKRYFLSNGIGGQLSTGVIGLAGNLQHIGTGVVAVGGAGASGHIGRDLDNGIAGQVGAGVVAAAGNLDHIGGGSLFVSGLGDSGHVGR